MARPFTESDIETLISMRKDGYTNGEIAEFLDRSIGTIEGKVTGLGISKFKHNPPWSDEEKETLRTMIVDHTKEDVSKVLGRTFSSVGNQLNRLGIKAKVVYNKKNGIKAKMWTKEEDQLLRMYCKEKTMTEVSKIIGRSVKSIETRSCRIKVRWRRKKVKEEHIIKEEKKALSNHAKNLLDMFDTFDEDCY